MIAPNKNHLLGKWGENLAATYLQEKGYSIICRNYRSPYGEIDIIAHDQGTLVFIEVKTRGNHHFGYPEDSISSKKVVHIINTAQNYLSQYDIDIPWRIDILAITRQANQTIEIHHIINAIQQ